MKKSSSNKNIIITLVIVIIVVTMLSVTAVQRANEGEPNLFQSIVSDSVAMVDETISAPVRWVRDGVAPVHNPFSTYAEDERLKKKTDNYDDASQQNKNYEREIGALEKELELNQTLTNYEEVTTNVITRSPNSWQDMLIIDKGSKDGIEVNMAVISQKGLIGRVIEVNTTSSRTESSSSSNESSNRLPVRISSINGEAFGLLKDHDGKLHALVVTQLTGNTDIKRGDTVQTPGLGEDSPANLLISTVIKTKPGSYELDREVYVRPHAEMYDMSVTTIIQRLAEDQFMLKKETVKHYLPIVLLSLMLIDGHLTKVLGEQSKDICMSNAHFSVLALLCCSTTFEKRYLLITTIILGAIYDAYYIDVIGIYTIVLPLIVWLMYVMKDVIYVNIFIEFFGMIAFITGYELFTVVVQLIFKLVIVNNTYFITRFLEPTLLLNVIISILFIFPSRKLFSDE